MAHIAEDNDFEALKKLVDESEGWSLELTKGDTKVWTRPVDGCNFHMVKIHTKFCEIPAEVLYDVLHDPDYRKEWDSHMLASQEIGCLNVNNDVGYYASKLKYTYKKLVNKNNHSFSQVSCPTPLKPRDFVLLRSWLDTGPNGEQMVLSRSILHKDWPAKKGFIRYYNL